MSEPATNANPPIRPQVTSYDSGYEFSFEYWSFVRRLVEEEDAEYIAPTEQEVLVSSAAG